MSHERAMDPKAAQKFEQIELPFSESVRPEPEESPDSVAEAVRETVERKKDGDDQLGHRSRT